MLSGRSRNLTEKHIYTQIAGSERSGESEADGGTSDESSDDEAGGSSQSHGERQQEGDMEAGVSSTSSESTSQVERSSSSMVSSSQGVSEQSSSSRHESSSTTSTLAEPAEDATESTPLIQSGLAKAKAQPKFGAVSKSEAKAQAKAKAKAKARPTSPTTVQRLTARSSWRLIASLAFAVAVLAASLVVYFEWCSLSAWGPWGECLPDSGQERCGPGVRNRTRSVIRGQCNGPDLLETEPCDLGECRLPDYIAEAPRMPCNSRSRGHLLRDAEEAFGSEAWEALRTCDRAYLCCHACSSAYPAAGAFACGGLQIAPRPLFGAAGCLSCFAAGPGPGCRGGRALCRRGFASAAGGAEGSLCCLAVGPRHARRPAAARAPPPPDEGDFERRPHANAFLGALRNPGAWPKSASEAACQQLCWRAAACRLYVYVSSAAATRRWRGRCVTWDEETAEEQGRASADSWIPERGVFSGLKAHLSYSDVFVTVRTLEGPESGSTGPFDLFICKDQAHCQLRSPIHLTATSCTAGERCLSPGTTAHFVGTAVVSEAFELHAIRIEGHTKDAWVFESLSVDCEGQLGSHHGRASVSMGRPWTVPVGCVTTSGWRVTAEPGTPCASRCHSGYGPHGWCWADAAQTLWGSCAAACRQSGHKPQAGAAMQESAVSCAELNWPTRSQYNDDPSVCGASSDRPLHGCSGPLSWDAAKEFCELIGARLCTRGELEADEAAGTGCDLDRQHVWSSSPCPRGYLAPPGASRYRATVAARCAPPAGASAQARCCADARKVVIAFQRSHRDAHVLPWHMRRASSPGLATWQVVAGSNHAGEQGFFLQSGMLDDQLPQDTQSVDVLLEDVPVSRLGGEVEFYFRMDSEPSWDKLHFYIDGVEETRSGFPVSGKIDWTLARFSFPARAGTDLHMFLWRFSKDRSDTVGDDVACIDKIIVYDVLSLD